MNRSGRRPNPGIERHELTRSVTRKVSHRLQFLHNALGLDLFIALLPGDRFVGFGQGFAIGRPIPFADVLTELPLPSGATGETAAPEAQPDGDATYEQAAR